MNEERFEGTSFSDGDQLDFHRGSQHAMSFEETRQREAASAPERTKSPEELAVERLRQTGLVLESFRHDQLLQQEGA